MRGSAARTKQRTLQATAVASRGAVLVRCGDRCTSGVLLEAPAAGALVLAPGLLLQGTKAAADDVLLAAQRAPAVSVVLRRGPAAVAEPAACSLAAAPRGADELAETPADVVAAWRWSELASELPELLSELSLSREERPDGAAVAAADAADAEAVAEVRRLLPVFLLLRLRPAPDKAPPLREALRRLLPLVPAVPPRGHPVCAACTPLNAPGLLGAVSWGVVSGSASLLTLTDARVTPGCEGAGVYRLPAEDDGEAAPLPCAVVMSPLTWWRGEAVGFTLCLGLRRLLGDALLRVGGDACPSPALPAPKRTPPEVASGDGSRLDRSVVLVRSGCSWGSGAVVGRGADQRLVLTCAHVVQVPDASVSVCWGGRSERARVAWRSPAGAPFDLAVLELEDRWRAADLVPLLVDTRPPRIGEPVLAAGFPLFSERSWPGRELLPMVTRGNVGGWWPSAPSQVLTTCCIQSGNSGGPLLRYDGDASTPTLIGTLVCTATAGTGTGAVIYPNVNFALWAGAYRKAVDEFLETGDERAFEQIHSKRDKTAEQQWKLYPPAISKL